MTEQQWQEFSKNVTLVHGVGDYTTNRACIMSACVAKLRLENGEDLGSATDEIECVCPTIRKFAIRFNDSDFWDSDLDRTQTLLPFVDKMLNTRGSRTLMERRAFLCADYAVRIFAANALILAGLDAEAKELRELSPVVDAGSANIAANASKAAYASAYTAYAPNAANAAKAAYAAYATAATATNAADAADAAYTAYATAATAANAAACGQQKRLCVELLNKLCEMTD